MRDKSTKSLIKLLVKSALIHEAAAGLHDYAIAACRKQLSKSAVIACPECGAAFNASFGYTVCPYCGTKLE